MVLSNTPPAGAGKVQRVTKTDLLLKIIEGLGLDNNFNPVGIRTKALAEVSGVPANSISVLLMPYVKSGRLCICKITVPGTAPQNEYRKGIGVAMPEFKPLNTKKAGIAVATTHHRTPAAEHKAVMPPKSCPIEIPEFLKKPQPAVGALHDRETAPRAINTGSTRSDSSVIPAEARAVAADRATPKPAARARMKEEPATTKASAGDAMQITISSEGVLDIVLPEFEGLCDSVQLNPEQVLHLGDFLHQTEGVWRP